MDGANYPYRRYGRGRAHPDKRSAAGTVVPETGRTDTDSGIGKPIPFDGICHGGKYRIGQRVTYIGNPAIGRDLRAIQANQRQHGFGPSAVGRVPVSIVPSTAGGAGAGATGIVRSALISCRESGRDAHYRVDMGDVGEFWISEGDLAE